MKNYLPMALLIPLMCGCSSVKLDYRELKDIHCTSGGDPTQYEVAFMDMASAWPVYDWRLRISDDAGTNFYNLYVYSSWLNKKPKKSVRCDPKSGYTTITLNMPAFRPSTDRLVLVDSEGIHPIEFRDHEKQPKAK